MCWGYRGYHYHRYQYGYGCDELEDWVYNPRCCEMYGEEDCREYYDNLDIREWVMWEWIMGALFIGGIVLTLTLCCCWRRGIEIFELFLTLSTLFLRLALFLSLSVQSMERLLLLQKTNCSRTNCSVSKRI